MYTIQQTINVFDEFISRHNEWVTLLPLANERILSDHNFYYTVAKEFHYEYNEFIDSIELIREKLVQDGKLPKFIRTKNVEYDFSLYISKIYKPFDGEIAQQYCELIERTSMTDINGFVFSMQRNLDKCAVGKTLGNDLQTYSEMQKVALSRFNRHGFMPEKIIELGISMGYDSLNAEQRMSWADIIRDDVYTEIEFEGHFLSFGAACDFIHKQIDYTIENY